MHIQTINYQKTYNLGNYQSERIGVEIALNAGDNAKDALDSARELVEEYHKQNIKNIQNEHCEPFSEPVETIKTQSPQTIAEKTIQFINDCKTVEELKAWELMSKNKPDVEKAYKEKLKSLKK